MHNMKLTNIAGEKEKDFKVDIMTFVTLILFDHSQSFRLYNSNVYVIT